VYAATHVLARRESVIQQAAPDYKGVEELLRKSGATQ